MNGKSREGSAGMRIIEQSKTSEAIDKKGRRGGVARTVSAGVPIDPSAGFVLSVNENDVLCGRGSPAVENEGNVRFRHLIQSRKADYMNTTKRVEKEIIAREVYDEIVRRGGRFLRRIESLIEAEQMGVPEGKISWTVIPKDNAIQKIKQALRDRENVGPLTLHDGSDYSWTEPKPSLSSSSSRSLEGQEYKLQSGRTAVLNSEDRASLAQIQQQGDALSPPLFHSGEVHRTAAITALLRGRVIPSGSPVLAATLLEENRRLGHLLDEKRRLRELLARDPRFLTNIRLDRPGPVPGNELDRFSSHLLMTGERDIGGGGLRSLLLQAEELKHKSPDKRLDHFQHSKTAVSGHRAFQPSEKAFHQIPTDRNDRAVSPKGFRAERQEREREITSKKVDTSRMDGRKKYDTNSLEYNQERLGFVIQSPSMEGRSSTKDSLSDPFSTSSLSVARGDESQSGVRIVADSSSRKAEKVKSQDDSTTKKHRNARQNKKKSSPTKEAKTSSNHSPLQNVPTVKNYLPGLSERQYQQESKGQRCLLVSYDRLKSGTVASTEMLSLSMIELHIVSALCSHGHPVFDCDDNYLHEDARKFVFGWTEFAQVLLAAAEKWIKRSRVGDEKSNVFSSSFVRDLESENKAFALAEKYALDPAELAAKTGMLLEKIFKKSRSKTADRDWTLAGSIVGWLHVELRSWATSLNTSEYPGGRPVAYSSEDFINDSNKDNAQKDVFTTKALLTAQDCRDILVQIASISRLRAMFLANDCFDTTKLLHEEVSKSQDLTWTEGPCWWGSQGGEQHFRHDAELMELLVLHGHMSVLECGFETFEPASVEKASIKFPCARLGLTNASIQQRITELAVRIHAYVVSERKKGILAKRKASFISDSMPPSKIRDMDGICEHQALVAAAILGLASGSDKDNHSVDSSGEFSSASSPGKIENQQPTKSVENAESDGSPCSVYNERNTKETEATEFSKRVLEQSCGSAFKKQRAAAKPS